ncbi:MAG: hypothetical protein K0R70_1174 [Steroidobacteraceae bacterium]|nr:hypothetical protein [Steroidobacteraceae bacterium]
MSASGKGTRSSSKTRVRKPPPRWRRYLVQAELELPPPQSHELRPAGSDGGDTFDEIEPLRWWQTRAAVFGLLALCGLLTATMGVVLWNARGDRDAAEAAESRVRTLTLRAINGERALRITPNPRSWSAGADATLAWPEPPQLVELQFPVRQVQYPAFALVVDKVDHGRVMVIERMTPDSNRDLRLALNSSAFGPGEYRIRLQGYTWRGQRVDVGWVRLVVSPPR